MTTIENYFEKLQDLQEKISDKHLRILFEDKKRFEKFSIRWESFLLDFSKTHVDKEVLSLLSSYCDEMGLKEIREDMFNGEKINWTEKRAVLHTALRNMSDKPVMVDGKDVMPDIRRVLEKMKAFSDDVRNGKWLGFTGKKVKHR